MSPFLLNRRQFLANASGSLASIALASLLNRDHLLASPSSRSASANATAQRPFKQEQARLPHHPPRAKRVIQLFMSGAASQCDTFDYKPELIKRHGQPFDPGPGVKLFQSSPGQCLMSPWTFRPRGQSGKFISDLVPHLASCADEMCFIHSMISKSNIHGPATFMQNTGFVLPGFPSMGAWVTYGLGSLNDNLPTFVVLPDSRGFAPNGPANWSAGFLPASCQATMIRPASANPIHDLFPPKNIPVSKEADRDALILLNELNHAHLSQRAADTELSSRIQAYELAARLQLSAPDVLDISNESAATKELYGLNDPVTEDFGRNCLIARRLIERGVRFVQVWSGADNGFPRRNWDAHEDIRVNHQDMATSMDKPAAALIKDLRSRGLLDDTIVHWTTEFGRMPCSQGTRGRDHNPFTFTTWLAGGGFRPGHTYGASDDLSYKAAENPTYCYDLHATMLHQLGIDHERLTFRHNGIDRRLTDVHGHVIDPVLI